MTAPRGGAVFLDRDGVINANVYYADTGLWEAPRRVDDFVLMPGALDAMRQLADAGYALFLVSNQPNQAKKKATRAEHDGIHAHLLQQLEEAGINLVESFYCFHHPIGADPALTGPCECRKPSPFFLLKAQRRHGVELSRSWMVGDRESDIACGQKAGARTVFVVTPNGAPSALSADYQAADLADASRFILREA